MVLDGWAVVHPSGLGNVVVAGPAMYRCRCVGKRSSTSSLQIHLSRMYPACVLNVSCMYPACILRQLSCLPSSSSWLAAERADPSATELAARQPGSLAHKGQAASGPG